MKKALLTIAVILAAISSQAQEMRIGLVGGINSTWLMNKNVFDADDQLDIQSSFGGNIGAEFTYLFTERVGLQLGIIYSGHNQKYRGEITGTTEEWETKVRMRYLDVPLLLRFTSSGGSYFEFGPQFGFLMNAEEEYDFPAIGLFPAENITGDTKNGFKSTNIAAVIGFGVDIDVADNMIIKTGLRLGYGFNDATEEYGSPAELSLANDEADSELGVGTSTSAAHIDDDNQFNYEKTSRVFGGLHVGFVYIFGPTSAQ